MSYIFKILTISTQLTILRIILVPFIVYSLYFNYWLTACLLLLLAAITDILDGAVARYRNEETYLGACLDPIADKILIISSYLTLVFVNSPIPKPFLFFVLIKEAIQVLGAFYLGFVNPVVDIKANMWGKITTVLQVLFILWVCISLELQYISLFVFNMFLMVVVVLNILTLASYSLLGIKGLRL